MTTFARLCVARLWNCSSLIVICCPLPVLSRPLLLSLRRYLGNGAGCAVFGYPREALRQGQLVEVQNATSSGKVNRCANYGRIFPLFPKQPLPR